MSAKCQKRTSEDPLHVFAAEAIALEPTHSKPRESVGAASPRRCPLRSKASPRVRSDQSCRQETLQQGSRRRTRRQSSRRQERQSGSCRHTSQLAQGEVPATFGGSLAASKEIDQCSCRHHPCNDLHRDVRSQRVIVSIPRPRIVDKQLTLRFYSDRGASPRCPSEWPP